MLWGDTLTAMLSFLLGLIGGVIIQSVRFRYNRRLDKIRRVMPHMETVHPIFETLMIDAEHACRLQEKNDASELDRYIARISETFNSFGKWYSEFVERGMKPELQSLDYNLYAGLYGIFTYHQMTKIHGVQFLSQSLVDIGAKLGKTMTLLEEFLKQ